MDRPTRAQQRAAAIDVSPARLAAEIERLIGERDVARRQAELARQELARILGGGPVPSDGGGNGGGATSVGGRLVGKVKAAAGAAAAGAALEAIQKERDEYLSALQRERAEFTNFKRRTAEERNAMYGLASEGLIRKVLGLADDFDLAVEHRPAGGVDEAWVEGIAAIDRKLRLLLESEGVSAVDASAGNQFDPREHEAVVNVPGTGRRGGEIVEELRRGYRLRDRVIRPALVAVAEDGIADGADADMQAAINEPTDLVN
ncbi:MAG: nucleotide exchange factor GrpE [Candidatus Limnocylindrales bacterium]